MLGVERIFENNPASNIVLKKEKNKITIKFRSEIFNENTFVNTLQKFLKLKESYNDEKITVMLKLGKISFKDKATYILLESLVYHLCKETKFKIKISAEELRLNSIYSSPIKFSILNEHINKEIAKEKFIKDFQELKLEKYRYRKIISCGDSINPSKILTNLISFFKMYNIDEEFKDQLAEMLVELVGNATEHSKSDCLIDLTIDEAVNIKDKHKCLTLDIIVLNFSEILLGNGVRRNFVKLISESKESVEGNFFKKKLKIAHDNHKEKFNEWYTEEDFFNISSFQWRFSGREDLVSRNGGTGLTKVIEFLLNFSEANDCYVYSGDRAIHFHKDFLGISRIEGERSGIYAGFNKECDYINYIPDERVIGKSPFYLNGTLYSLKFILPILGGKNE